MTHYDENRNYDHSKFHFRKVAARCTYCNSTCSEVPSTIAGVLDNLGNTDTMTLELGCTLDAVCREAATSCADSGSTCSEVPATIADLLDDYLGNTDTKALDIGHTLDAVYDLTSQHAFWDDEEGITKLFRLLKARYPQLDE